MRLASSTLTLVVALLLAGCAAHVDTSFVPTAELEKKAGGVLEQQVGRAPDSIDCPDLLPVRVGADVRCVLTDGDQRIGLTVTLSELNEDDSYVLSVAVDDQALPDGS